MAVVTTAVATAAITSAALHSALRAKARNTRRHFNTILGQAAIVVLFAQPASLSAM